MCDDDDGINFHYVMLSALAFVFIVKFNQIFSLSLSLSLAWIHFMMLINEGEINLFSSCQIFPY